MAQQKEIDKLTYEQAYQELQTIVDTLENGLQSLEDTMKLFERGQALSKHCENLLNRAQLKLRQVSKESKSHEGSDYDRQDDKQ